jgi:hypothetical protein
MIFGIGIGPQLVVLGGAVLITLIGFQVLEGKRIVHFKGKLHMRVHRVVGWSIAAFGVVHAVIALTFLGYLPL